MFFYILYINFEEAVQRLNVNQKVDFNNNVIIGLSRFSTFKLFHTEFETWVIVPRSPKFLFG